ncbi:hypothetical protein PF005_g24994 [Phytophthora fragariae]|uniref:Uncharacterized protein n=1 Tax=Phytophthora fragariae TaxID=53985 RepID=A0A6A3HW53_9STRA|nr:hypothetical protein PF003_g7486 [Phytophthora fragariae]KAE8923805.1 hypothetical protein PF009_g25949 [Phytophthora fragariae]KAE8971978.1 hypothetical protein PF011_g25822 [Phytophthora fragariae]KAE9068382.1 hypothetical protein PF010_g27086 [Phytophthora fragariae]KAE9075347.1 hypothetical protein PF007_g25048 [Phytophthora fragariae]
MEYRRGGGSQTTIPRRKRKKGPTRKEAARIRVVERLGEEAVNRIQDDWAFWDTGYGGKE